MFVHGTILIKKMIEFFDFLIIMVVILGSNTLAQDNEQSLSFGGELTGLELGLTDGLDLPWDTLIPGDQWWLTYCFASDQVGTSPTMDTDFSFPIQNYSINIGEFAFSETGACVGEVRVTYGAEILVRYEVFIVLADGALFHLDLARSEYLTKTSGTALKTTERMTELDLECFDIREISLVANPSQFNGAFGTVNFAKADKCIPEPRNCCIDFSDGELNGFNDGGTNILLEVREGGQAGGDDRYLHVTDRSGPSEIFGPAFCQGDWTKSYFDGCGAFCFDVRIFFDGCIPGIERCENGPLQIKPTIEIISDPDGSGPQNPIRALYRSNLSITDDRGSNPGWHHVCAPIDPLRNGQLPSDENGSWEMLDGNPNSLWDGLLSNVTAIKFPIDFTGNPAEEVGYDNLCLRDDVCGCMILNNDNVLCEIGEEGLTGRYTYTFDLVNQSGVTANYLLIPGPSVMPHVVNLANPLPDGGSTKVSLVVDGVAPDSEHCLNMILADEDVEDCCSVVKCIEIPSCDCFQLPKWVTSCVQGAPGSFKLQFDLTNLTPDEIAHLFLIPQDANVTISPDYQALNGLSFLETGRDLTVTVSGATPGTDLCILMTIHDEELNECCSRVICIPVPDC